MLKSLAIIIALYIMAQYVQMSRGRKIIGQILIAALFMVTFFLMMGIIVT